MDLNPNDVQNEGNKSTASSSKDGGAAGTAVGGNPEGDGGVGLESDEVKIRAIPAPCAPSQEEWDQHMLTHIPYRSWCPHCVRGRGRHDRHGPSSNCGTIPELGADYWFMGNDGKTLGESEEASAEGLMPVLVYGVRAAQEVEPAGAVFAHLVPSKGSSPLVVDQVVDDLDSLGY